MYLIKLKYFVFSEKNIDFITHVIIIIDLSFYSKLQLVIILLLYVFKGVKHTRVKANYFMHTILSLTEHTNAKANAFFLTLSATWKFQNMLFVMVTLLLTLLILLLGRFLNICIFIDLKFENKWSLCRIIFYCIFSRPYFDNILRYLSLGTTLCYSS